MVEPPNCPDCGAKLSACIHAADGMRLNCWLCEQCGRIEKPTGREYQLTARDIEAVNGSVL